MRKHFLVPGLILLFLITATSLVILYGKGYRIAFKQDIPQLSKTGVLVANSTPNAAQVFIDNHLTTATDNTINLPPGTYDIKIQKEGYFPWEKQLKIEAEVVTKAEARLFPVAPKLESIATAQVQNPIIDPSGTKIAFQISSESAVRKNGIYVLNMTANNLSVPILTLQSSSTQIADNTLDQFSEAKLKWSPDGSELTAEISTSPGISTTYLLAANRFNDSPQDVTAILSSVQDEWSQQKLENNRSLRSGLKKDLRALIDANFTIIKWSPDETKALYQASASAELPLIIKPRIPGINKLVENRKITKGDLYIYDTKEDTNYPIQLSLPASCSPQTDNLLEPFANCTLPFLWFPDSKHLVNINDKKIIIMDDDGSNKITVYAGPFVDNFAIPWPDSSKIVILTNFSNPDIPPTFYTIGLK